ncbi:sensor histidine kinase [Parvularcula maris]|uniref:histidine kinase n=1 Tax=Parvularcula maris TaxID=2965077 RepID=A0A9X2LB68_9PROT|nr:sensor histidine kinase [Parvularcula maris]MCQ8186341.1 sensor histidine kinase [Parvularcula maris]
MRTSISVFLFFALSMLICAHAEGAVEKSLDISEARNLAQLRPFMAGYLEPGTDMAASDIARLPLSRFQPIEGPEPEFGFTDDTIWLRLPVANPEPADIERVLWLHTNFMSELSVWKAAGDTTELLLEQGRNSAFSTRPIRLPNLVVPFTLTVGEEAVLLIRYRSDGNSHLPMSIETYEGFVEKHERRGARLFMFYGAGAIFVVVSFAAFVFRRESVFLFYALYALTVILYIMQRDGYAFMLFWPDAPVVNNFISLPLGCALIGFGALFGRALFRTRGRFEVVDRVLLGIAAISLAIPFTPLLIDQSQAKAYAFMWFLIAAVIIMACAVFCWRKVGERTIFFVIGWFGLIIASFATVFINFTDMAGSRQVVLNIMRGALLFDATMMGCALVYGYLQVWRRSEEADLARLELAERLAGLERRYSDLKEAAEARGQRIADATHDIRQPLYALRSSIGNLLSGPRASATELTAVRSSLNYLEELIDNQLTDPASFVSLGRTDSEEHPVNLILDAVASMFRSEAEGKNLRFRIVACGGSMKGDPLKLTRIVANLVANAIEYTDVGGVLVGCRQRRGRLGIEVYDTGRGIEASNLPRLCLSGERGQEDDVSEPGRGRGLAIVRQLAVQEGITVSVRSAADRGTLFRIEPDASDRPLALGPGAMLLR